MIKKILFIRRDNIGDLVCSTAAIHAVRQAYPNAKIGILVNTYNADVVKNSPDIDEVYVYEKAKHVPEKSKISVWFNNLKILMKIRKEKYDVAIACGSYSPRLARYTYMTGAKIRIGYLSLHNKKSFFYNIALQEPKKPMHEVERVFNLLSPLRIDGLPDKLRVFPLQACVEEIKEFLQNKIHFVNPQNNSSLIVFHISSRKPENRWSAEKFIELAKMIIQNYQANILLLWSPGAQENPYHPGDDRKADKIINSGLPNIIGYKTTQLKQLIAALSLASLVVCLDGGAMHIAAALGKPIVTIWGSTDSVRWQPWGVKHILLQSDTKKAEDIAPQTVFQAVQKLLEEI